MEQLGNAFGKKYVCVLWNETEDAYTNLPSYDASFVHVNSLLTKEEAIYLSDYVVSFAERDIAMGRLMQKPCIFWNNQSPAELVKML